jgi:hypothetical protein
LSKQKQRDWDQHEDYIVQDGIEEGDVTEIMLERIGTLKENSWPSTARSVDHDR